MVTLAVGTQRVILAKDGVKAMRFASLRGPKSEDRGGLEVTGSARFDTHGVVQLTRYGRKYVPDAFYPHGLEELVLLVRPNLVELLDECGAVIHKYPARVERVLKLQCDEPDERNLPKGVLDLDSANLGVLPEDREASLDFGPYVAIRPRWKLVYDGSPEPESRIEACGMVVDRIGAFAFTPSIQRSVEAMMPGYFKWLEYDVPASILGLQLSGEPKNRARLW